MPHAHETEPLQIGMEPADERRRGRPTLEEAIILRTTLLDQAFLLVVERGVHGFSVDLLARNTGITKRTIYRHFDSKAALIEAVVAREAQPLIDSTSLPSDRYPPLPRLREWLSRIFNYSASQNARRVRLFLSSASLTEDWAASMLQRVLSAFNETGKALIMDAQQSGDLMATDPKQLLRLLLDLTIGTLERWFDDFSESLADRSDDLNNLFITRWNCFLLLARPHWSGSTAVGADDVSLDGEEA